LAVTTVIQLLEDDHGVDIVTLLAIYGRTKSNTEGDTDTQTHTERNMQRATPAGGVMHLQTFDRDFVTLR